MIIPVECTASTSTLMAERADDLEHGDVITTLRQTRGRGQRGNSWESEDGKNLTFSILLLPKTIDASRQFELSQIVSIAVALELRQLLATDEVRIKWPNDIYYRDSKICGMLIEHVISGAGIARSIAGIGINVNQEAFLSDAPNPISMWQISGLQYDLDLLLEGIVDRIHDDFNDYERNPDPQALAATYRALLWRGEGYWPYHDNVRGIYIEARIAHIAPSGLLTLETRDGRTYTYAFKEVTAII